MRLRDRERDFGRRREEATIRGGDCGEPALPIWFRPKSAKVRVWGKSGKREVDAQSPWLLLAATVFRSTNSGRGSGLRVTIDCKPENGHFKTRGVGKLDEEGKFKVSVYRKTVKDGKLNEECYAQLHSASAAPCPTHNGLESSKVVFKSKAKGKYTLSWLVNSSSPSCHALQLSCDLTNQEARCGMYSQAISTPIVEVSCYFNQSVYFNGIFVM